MIFSSIINFLQIIRCRVLLPPNNSSVGVNKTSEPQADSPLNQIPHECVCLYIIFVKVWGSIIASGTQLLSTCSMHLPAHRTQPNHFFHKCTIEWPWEDLYSVPSPLGSGWSKSPQQCARCIRKMRVLNKLCVEKTHIHTPSSRRLHPHHARDAFKLCGRFM